MGEDSQTEEKKEGAQGTNKNLYYVVVPVVLLLVLGGWFMSRKSVKETENKSESAETVISKVPAKEEAGNEETATNGGKTGAVKEITVEGSEFSFKPKGIELAKGDRVKLTFKNVGRQSHNFVIDELEIETKTIPGGSSDTIEFVAEESGTFEFYCSVDNHKSFGMKGEMGVE